MKTVEAEADTKHRVEITIADGMISVELHCPFEPSVLARPCWPKEEDGAPYELQAGTEEGCVWKPWMDEGGMESIRNVSILNFRLLKAEMDDDVMRFELGCYMNSSSD